MSYYDRALEMKDELVANRRYLHENAEVGLTPVSYTHLIY